MGRKWYWNDSRTYKRPGMTTPGMDRINEARRKAEQEAKKRNEPNS